MAMAGTRSATHSAASYGATAHLLRQRVRLSDRNGYSVRHPDRVCRGRIRFPDPNYAASNPESRGLSAAAMGDMGLFAWSSVFSSRRTCLRDHAVQYKLGRLHA